MPKEISSLHLIHKDTPVNCAVFTQISKYGKLWSVAAQNPHPESAMLLQKLGLSSGYMRAKTSMVHAKTCMSLKFVHSPGHKFKLLAV